MARQSKPRKSLGQKQTIERVMHEFKRGELRTAGTGPKVRNRRQAIAIALSEAGASNRDPGRTKSKASAGKGRASRQRAGSRASRAGGARTRAELYAEARRRDVPGRSRMSKAELERALGR